jgi:hypothetical protein
MSKQNNSVLCDECNEKIIALWCTLCNAKRFKSSAWTSGNDEMDRYILETQTTAKRPETLLEWVEPSKFNNFEKIQFSKNKKAYWEEGYVIGYDIKKKEWKRSSGQWVKLVTHYCEKYLTKHFLKSVYYFVFFLFLILSINEHHFTLPFNLGT